MTDPSHFNALAGLYARARPRYPNALWERLGDLGLLRAGLRIIELGAGTGEATTELLAAGASVVAVEPGAALAERLRERCPAAEVVVARAEEVALGEAGFDLAVAATSVHWLDLDVVLPALHAALVQNGHFAVWRHAFGDSRVVVTPFRERVNAIVSSRAREPARPGPDELDTAGWVQRLSATGQFAVVHVEEFRWSIDLTAAQIGELFRTFSNWTRQEADAAAQAARDLGGSVTEHYVTPLIVLRKVAAERDSVGA